MCNLSFYLPESRILDKEANIASYDSLEGKVEKLYFPPTSFFSLISEVILAKGKMRKLVSRRGRRGGVGQIITLVCCTKKQKDIMDPLRKVNLFRLEMILLDFFQVPECIDKLAQAGLKIWLLTGDKTETAVNIG